MTPALHDAYIALYRSQECDRHLMAVQYIGEAIDLLRDGGYPELADELEDLTDDMGRGDIVGFMNSLVTKPVTQRMAAE